MDLSPKILNERDKNILFGRIASILLDKGEIEQAIKICENGLKKYPMYAQGHYILALCYQKSEKYDEARVEFERVLRYDPNHLNALKELADISRINGLTDIYREYLFRLYNLEPLNEQIISQVKDIGEFDNWTGEIDEPSPDFINREHIVAEEESDLPVIEEQEETDRLIEEDTFDLHEGYDNHDFDKTTMSDVRNDEEVSVEKIDLSQFENKDDDFTTIMDGIFRPTQEEDTDDDHLEDILPEEDVQEDEALAEERPFESAFNLDEEIEHDHSGEPSEDIADDLFLEKEVEKTAEDTDEFDVDPDSASDEDHEHDDAPDDYSRDEADRVNHVENSFINLNGDYPSEEDTEKKETSSENDDLLMKDMDQEVFDTEQADVPEQNQPEKEGSDSDVDDPLLLHTDEELDKQILKRIHDIEKNIKITDSPGLGNAEEEEKDITGQQNDMDTEKADKERKMSEFELDESRYGNEELDADTGESEESLFEQDNIDNKNKESLIDVDQKELGYEEEKSRPGLDETIPKEIKDDLIIEKSESITEDQDPTELRPKIATQTLGEILVSQKKFKEAKKVFEALRKKNPDNTLFEKKIAFLDKLISLEKNE